MSDDGRKEFSICLKDDVTPVLSKMDAGLDKTKAKLDENKKSQTEATLDAIKTVTSLSAVVGGLNAVTSSMNVLQIGSEETRGAMMKLSAGIQMVVGTAQMLQGTIILIKSLNMALKGTAIMSAWAAVCAHPLLGLAIVGAGGAAAGYIIGQMQSNSSTTTINYNSQPTEEVRKSQTVVNTGGYA